MRAFLAQRRRLLIALCLIALGFAVIIPLRARLAPTPPKADLRKLPPFAIIYSREAEHHAQEVIWQRGADTKRARVLYRSQAAPSPHAIPRDFGYLPAPTGAWVFVWETVRGLRAATPKIKWWPFPDYEHPADHTEWWLVRVADGKRYLMAQAKGASGVLPHWYGESDVWLDLVKGGQKWQVDLRGAAPTLDKPLPAGGDEVRDTDHDLRGGKAFIRDNFDADRRAALKLFPEVQSDPRTAVEYLLLRPMGIVTGGGTELSASPNKRQVVRSEATRAEGKGSEARLDVYDVATSARLWGRTATNAGAFRSARWSPDGTLLSFTQTTGDEATDRVTVVDAATGAEVTRLPHATNAFVVPVVGEKQGQPVIPCACTLKERK